VTIITGDAARVGDAGSNLQQAQAQGRMEDCLSTLRFLMKADFSPARIVK